MTNAIVNPWFFYWMSVCGTLDIVCSVVTFFGWTGIVLAVIMWTCLTCGGQYDDETAVFMMKCCKKGLVPVILATLAAIFVPSETTLMQMTVASYVTPENVSNAYQIVLDVTNDLLGIVGK